jgi:tRNA C32,U32 (ribose-2'-O)-methylase TrmJ
MSIKNVHFILARPQMGGENIGSVARAIKKFLT